MSFVSPEDGLGTIAYKAKGFRIVHEPRKAICMSRERPYANPQRLLMSVGMVGLMTKYLGELFDAGVTIRTLSKIIE